VNWLLRAVKALAPQPPERPHRIIHPDDYPELSVDPYLYNLSGVSPGLCNRVFSVIPAKGMGFTDVCTLPYQHEGDHGRV
jgi:hypothetical protein